MANEQIIIEVAVDNNAARKQVVDLEKNLLALRKEQRELEKAFKDDKITTEQYASAKVELSNRIKETTSAQREAEKASKVEANSINALRAQLSKLTAERDNTNQSTLEGVEAASALDKRIAGLTERIKSNEEAGLNFKRSVGNYKNSIIDAGRATNVFGINVGQVSDLMKASSNSVGGASNALKLFRVALASTGIGLIVIALGSLVAYFTKTQEGAEKLSKIMAALGATVDVLTDRFSQFGRFLVTLFDPAVDSAEQFRKVYQGIGDEIAQEAIAASNIQEFANQLARDQVNFLTRQAELEEQITELKSKGSDASLTNLEREEALAKAIDLSKQLTNERLALQTREFSLLTARNALGESSLDDVRKEKEEQIALNKARKDGINEQKELRNQLTALVKADQAAAIAAAKRLQDEQKKAAEEQAKMLQAFERGLLEYYQLDLQQRLLYAERGSAEELRIRQEQIDTALEMSLIGVEQESQQEINLRKGAYVQRQQLELEHQNFLKAQREKEKADQRALQDAIAADIAERDRQELELERIKQDGKAALIIGTTDLITQVTKEGNKVAQVAAIAETGYLTYVAAQKAAAAYPFPTNVPFVAGAILQGLANVAAITNFKFARGGYVEGPGTGTSDSIPARLSNGESVINAKSTAMFKPILSAINEAGGGVAFAGAYKPNYHNNFAAGGIATGQPIVQDVIRNGQIGDLANTMKNIKIYTAITDVRKADANYTEVVNKANF